jgi:beta-lactamase class A
MSLRDTVEAILGSAPATFGIAACHLSRSETILINEHEVFPSASVIKVPILVEIMFQRDEGRLSLDETFSLRESDKVAGSGVLRDLHEGLELTLRDLAVLMIIVSDNTATNMIIDRIGMDAVNERMRGLGLTSVTLARKMYDWEQQKLGNENLISAHEMMLLLRWIAEGRISSKSTSEEIIEIMARQQYRDRIPLLLPEDIRVANKTGSIARVTHDVGVVYTPDGPYVLCALARDVDEVFRAERAIAEVSRALYDHFTQA